MPPMVWRTLAPQGMPPHTAAAARGGIAGACIHITQHKHRNYVCARSGSRENYDANLADALLYRARVRFSRSRQRCTCVCALVFVCVYACVYMCLFGSNELAAVHLRYRTTTTTTPAECAKLVV